MMSPKVQPLITNMHLTCTEIHLRTRMGSRMERIRLKIQRYRLQMIQTYSSTQRWQQVKRKGQSDVTNNQLAQNTFQYKSTLFHVQKVIQNRVPFIEKTKKLKTFSFIFHDDFLFVQCTQPLLFIFIPRLICQ